MFIKLKSKFAFCANSRSFLIAFFTVFIFDLAPCAHNTIPFLKYITFFTRFTDSSCRNCWD